MDLFDFILLSWLFGDDKKCEPKENKNETKDEKAITLLGIILLILGLAPSWVGFLIPFAPNIFEDVVSSLLGEAYGTSKFIAYGVSSIMWGILLFFLQRAASLSVTRKSLSILSVLFLLIGLGMLFYSITSVMGNLFSTIKVLEDVS